MKKYFFINFILPNIANTNNIMHSKTLLQILKPLAPAIDSKPMLPICECVMIKNGRAYATNLELSISNACDLPDMILPYAQTMARLSVLNEEVSIIDEDGKYIIKAGYKKFPLPKFRDVNTFPAIPNAPIQISDVDAGFITAVVEAAKNTSNDPMIQWRHVFICDEWIVGNDNYGMYKFDTELSLPNIAVPKIFAKTISRLSSGNISATDTHLFFKSGEIEITVLLAESNFPRFGGLFPSFVQNLSIIRGDFEIALKQASVSAPTSVTLHIASGQCNISSLNNDFVDCAAATDLNMDVTFRPDILSRVISSLPDECDTLEFMIESETKPVYVKYKNITLLIMPYAK